MLTHCILPATWPPTRGPVPYGQKVYEALGDRALVVGGGCGTVGVGGYTLGGGVGYLSRVYGLAIDNVLSYTVATAAGAIANVTASSDPDLFWALSGGGVRHTVGLGLTLSNLAIVRIFNPLPKGRAAVTVTPPSKDTGTARESMLVPESMLHLIPVVVVMPDSCSQGGNFGVLLDVTFVCHRPARPAIATTSFAWTMAIPQAKQILAFYAEWLRAGAGVPDALTAYVAMTARVLAITFFFVGTYGNFDIVLDHFSRIFLLHPTPHALCTVFYLVTMLIGCWLVLGIRFCDQFGASGLQRVTHCCCRGGSCLRGRPR